jgi:mRNA interferase RelE/StbE
VPYTVLLHPKAAYALNKMDEQLKKRITEHLKELINHPQKSGKHMKYSEFWSLRIGDYRAIYEINTDKKQVTILYIGHRKKVYDDFSKLF